MGGVTELRYQPQAKQLNLYPEQLNGRVQQ